MGIDGVQSDLPGPAVSGAARRTAQLSVRVNDPTFLCFWLSITVLATGVNGSQIDQPFVVSYADGSSTTVRQSLSDWHTSQHCPGESIALAMNDRVTPAGALQSGVFNLYAYTFQTDPSRTLASLSLPKNRGVVVLSVNTMTQ